MGQTAKGQWKQRTKTKTASSSTIIVRITSSFFLSIPIIPVQSSNTSRRYGGRPPCFLVVVSDWLRYEFCCRDMLHNRPHEGSWHPCNVLSPRCVHEVYQVERRATCCGDKMSPKLMLHNYDSTSSHDGTCRCNMSLRHVPATFSCVCKRYDFCPRYMSRLHVPTTCPLSVYYTNFGRYFMSL